MERTAYKKFMETVATALAQHHSLQPLGEVPRVVESNEMLSYRLRQAIEHLPEHLQHFEQVFTSEYNAICWAATYDDVFTQLSEFLTDNHVRSYTTVDDSESPLLKEIGLRYYLEDQRILQASDGQVQFFVADRMVADSGSLLFLGRNNTYLRRLNNKVLNVCFVGVTDLLASMADVKPWVATCRQAYASDRATDSFILFKRAPRCRTLLFIIDNGRSNVLQRRELRSIYSCIGCHRCEECCPVDRLIGKEAYDNVFTGPVGRILLPYTESITDYQHVVYACTLCGRCDSVCPVHIPLSQLILSSRNHIKSSVEADVAMVEVMRDFDRVASQRRHPNRPYFLRRRELRRLLNQSEQQLATPVLADDTVWQQLVKSRR